MKICPAKAFDIPSIMNIERAAFIPSIQEAQKTFEERLLVFPHGFFVLQDADEKTVLAQGHAVTAGYFCSEIWSAIPQSDEPFTLGHNAAKTHNPSGPVLYVSSFALWSEYRGQGFAQNFFKNSLCAVCQSFATIKKVLLLVNEEWSSALKIYKNLGFLPLRTIKGFFPSLHKKKSDGILMTADSCLFTEKKSLEERV